MVDALATADATEDDRFLVEPLRRMRIVTGLPITSSPCSQTAAGAVVPVVMTPSGFCQDGILEDSTIAAIPR